MMAKYWSEFDASAKPVRLLTDMAALRELCQKESRWELWSRSTGFNSKRSGCLLIPDASGSLEVVLLVVDQNNPCASYGALIRVLPEGKYHLEQKGLCEAQAEYKQALLLITQEQYKFDIDNELEPTVFWSIPAGMDVSKEALTVSALDRVRDLINMPANYMLPPDLFLATKSLCDEYEAELTTIQGRDLLAAGYEGTYRVGQVGAEPPCMLDFSWGEKSHPLLTILGKGVCFDSGGLNIKTGKGMLTMKKDMGGAAHALGLAELIMGNKLPVRLRVIIPAVENGIGQGAYRPGDVLRYKDGTTVEVTNTDAEGRLVIADAILAACEDEKPDCLIDFTTLTGAARVAVGLSMAAFFTNKTENIAPFQSYVADMEDPVWPLPLFDRYKKALKSDVADMANASLTGYGGAITAALFLKHFVPDDVEWWHFDISASKGGETAEAAVMGMRAVFAWLEKKYGA